MPLTAGGMTGAGAATVLVKVPSVESLLAADGDFRAWDPPENNHDGGILRRSLFPFAWTDRLGETFTNLDLALFPGVGHFPHRPVMPGVLMLEAMAQAAALLAFETVGQKTDDKSVYYFAGIDGARFKRPVSPGDQLQLDVRFEMQKRGLWKFSGLATVDGARAAEAPDEIDRDFPTSRDTCRARYAATEEQRLDAGGETHWRRHRRRDHRWRATNPARPARARA